MKDEMSKKTQSPCNLAEDNDKADHLSLNRGSLITMDSEFMTSSTSYYQGNPSQTIFNDKHM